MSEDSKLNDIIKQVYATLGEFVEIDSGDALPGITEFLVADS